MLEDVVRLNERVGKLGTHFEQARGDVESIRISTEGIVRHGRSEITRRRAGRGQGEIGIRH